MSDSGTTTGAMHSTGMTWTVRGGRVLSLEPGLIMGILNVTPDSFSDGGAYVDPERAAAHALQMAEAGASIIDVGGESTRPGAQRIGSDEQIARCIPVIERIRAASEVVVSIDTTNARVARAALDAGADVVNDVAAGVEDDSMFAVAAESGAGLILMHRLRPPDSDSYSDAYRAGAAPTYDDVVDEVGAWLADRAAAAIAAGVDRASIMLDPGLGFGKTVDQNFALMARTSELAGLGYPLLGASSRKSFLGAVTGIEGPADRDAASVAAAAVQFLGGARVFRVHAVEPHVSAVSVWQAAARAGLARDGLE